MEVEKSSAERPVEDEPSDGVQGPDVGEEEGGGLPAKPSSQVQLEPETDQSLQLEASAVTPLPAPERERPQEPQPQSARLGSTSTKLTDSDRPQTHNQGQRSSQPQPPATAPASSLSRCVDPHAHGGGAESAAAGSAGSVVSRGLVRPHASRSYMSLVSVGQGGSRRGSSMSRNQGPPDHGLPPGLQQLIARLTHTKDLGLIAYLSALAGESRVLAGSGGRRPLKPLKPHSTKSAFKSKSILKSGRQQIRWEPTFRVEPVRPFRWDPVHTLVGKALSTALEEAPMATQPQAAYSREYAVDVCRILAAYITHCVKNLDFSRYKVATLVTTIEQQYQGVYSDLRVLWDPDRDGYCHVQITTTTLIAQAIVFAAYWD